MQDILLTQIRLALLFALWILAIIRTGKTTVQDGGDVVLCIIRYRVYFYYDKHRTSGACVLTVYSISL